MALKPYEEEDVFSKSLAHCGLPNNDKFYFDIF